ncbi:monooxygenase [Calidithermus roseus]|uniref:Cytochrome c domain-containing protein n=1 Tax=Calidithermus roseus TaxID=1644118 RepID=A0A399EXR2_9DEIN|nr:monooxygenase [Calidithermus roseus]RIH88798.1 hypothetical protein Mrose_00626 [Calidithermus roseus]
MKARHWILAGLLLWLGGSGGAADGLPTYYDAVAPILNTHCVGCHTEGGIAPFPLDSAEWAVKMAPAIASAVAEGRMPPWPPGEASPKMRGERRLSPEAIATLVSWAKAGAPLGEAKNPTLTPNKSVARTPDLVAAMPRAYTPDSRLYDDYRCFLLDTGLERDTFVQGYRIQPGQSQLVHHVILFVIGPEAVQRARAQDGADGRPGWQCFGGPSLGAGTGSLGNALGFWVPGTQGTDYPPGTGKEIKAGSRIVMQVHYNLSAPAHPDQTRLELFFADPASQPKSIRRMILAAPVEVRCPPGVSGEACGRAFALERSELKRVADGIHLLCGTTLEDYLRRDIGDGSHQETHCDFSVREDGVALGVLAHMHLRGKALRISLNPGTPGEKVLLDIPRWDFHWQGEYWFEEPIALRQGDRVRISCVYDNAEAIPGPDGRPLEPRYLTWGEGTTDEMCLGGISWVK